MKNDGMTIVYQKLTEEQKGYFDHQQRIGPFAQPLPHSHLQAMGWPSFGAIQKEIRSKWGEESHPMAYFQGIFNSCGQYTNTATPPARQGAEAFF